MLAPAGAGLGEVRQGEANRPPAAEIDGRSSIVPNDVLATAIEEVEGRTFVFYGMADSKIAVAHLERRADSAP